MYAPHRTSRNAGLEPQVKTEANLVHPMPAGNRRARARHSYSGLMTRDAQMAIEATSALGSPRAGFEAILEDVAKRLEYGKPVRDALNVILSLAGRQPLAGAAEALTPAQAAFYDIAANFPLLPCAQEAPAQPAQTDPEWWFIGVWSYGRMWLSRSRPEDPECRWLGQSALPAAVASALAICADGMQRALEECDAQMHDFFAGCDDRTFRHMLHEVHESIDHMDPILLYVGDVTFTNFGRFNNLQERNGADLPACFYRRLRRMTLADWTREEKIFVFCLYWLRMAGCRGEEFNGRQLCPVRLNAYLDRRLADYRARAPQLFGEAAPTIAAKARLLARCKQACAADVITYRWINGLNFYKEERLRPRAPAPGPALPADLAAYLASSYGAAAVAGESLEQIFGRCIARMAQSGFASDDPELHAFEKLLKAIVDAATAATGSDVGMTRGFRDVARWQRAFAAQSYEAVCAWTPGEYFCGVFPSVALQARLGAKPDLLIKILSACSGRMQFNSWHYAPGYCPRERVPSDRHFYLPPRMPDMTVWSDQHHAGHAMAAVRFAIRSPAALDIAGHNYPGMVDLRLFRRDGAEYTDAEFVAALRYTECLRAAWQALADHVAGSGQAVTVNAFDKEWFKRYYGGSGQARQAPMPAPAQAIMPRGVGSKTAIGELFRILCAHATEDRVALVEARHQQPECILTYRALVAHATHLHHALACRGIAPGACLAVWSPRPLHQAVAIVAGLAAGCIIHPINPRLSTAMLEGQLRHARPDLLIADDGVEVPSVIAGALRCAPWRALFSATGSAGSADDAGRAVATDAPDTTGMAADERGGLLVYTSGSTGTPKGVLLDWPRIRANVRHAIGALGYEAGWVAGSLLPRFHTFTVISDLLPSLLLGGRTVLVDAFDLQQVTTVVDAFTRHAVRSYSAAPVVLEALCAVHAWAGTPSLRFAVAGAAPLTEKTRLAYCAAFGHPVIPCYGLSETTCFAAISPADRIRPGAVGVSAGIDIAVFDEFGMRAPPGATGELAMRGPSVIRGYHRDHDARFGRAFPGDGWFLTGDVGRVDDEGYVFVTGRKKNMVIRGGEKVYLEDLDRCLAEHLPIADCASIAICEPGGPGIDIALTFIVALEDHPVTRDEVRALVSKTLTARHVPDRICFIDHIPRTPSGKVARPALLAWAGTLNALALSQ
jgi:acyl-CoA synthetase (AMP-forming)/AMP-acid ligase II